jgi:hypothetical protein
MTTAERENALDIQQAVFKGELYAFSRIETMLSDRKEILVRIIGKEKNSRPIEENLDNPYVQRLIEIGMFLDEIAILKRQVRQAHAETLTK